MAPPAPMPFRQFKRLLKRAKLTLKETAKAKHYLIFDASGNFVSTAFIIHGANVVGENVTGQDAATIKKYIKENKL